MSFLFRCRKKIRQWKHSPPKKIEPEVFLLLNMYEMTNYIRTFVRNYHDPITDIDAAQQS